MDSFNLIQAILTGFFFARPTYELIQDEFQCEPQDVVDVKGKDEMDV